MQSRRAGRVRTTWTRRVACSRKRGSLAMRCRDRFAACGRREILAVQAVVATRRYWLMKTEPDVFSIADLRKKGRSAWDGVRNYTARNFMKDEMAVGDLVLFYHSNATPPGVAGIARVCSATYPDPTQFDPKSEYYDPKSKPEAPRWWLIDVEFVEELPRFLPLPLLREAQALSDMMLLRKGMRLSVQPVSKEHFRWILKAGGAKIKA